MYKINYNILQSSQGRQMNHMRFGNEVEPVYGPEHIMPYSNPNDERIEELKKDVEGSPQLNPVKCFSVLIGSLGYAVDYFKGSNAAEIKTEGDARAEEMRMQRNILSIMFLAALAFAGYLIFF